MTARTKLASAFLAFALTFSLTAWPQETPSSATTQGANASEQGGISAYRNSPEHYYKLKFRVLDISPEGKVVNSRSYSETIASGAKSSGTSSIRTGDQIPVATGTSGSFTQYGHFNIGTKIDANRAEIVGQVLRLHVIADISTISTTAPGTSEHPVFRQTSWDSNVTVPVDKPTIIFSADNDADKGKTELELTAIPISQ